MKMQSKKTLDSSCRCSWWYLPRFIAFLVVMGLLIPLQLLPAKGSHLTADTIRGFGVQEQRPETTTPRNPGEMAKLLEDSGFLRNIREVRLDGVTTTVQGDLITLHNLRVLSDTTDFDDYLSINFVLDLETLRLIPVKLEITPDLGLYYRDEQLFSKDVLSDIFLRTSDGRTLAPDRLHTITAGPDDEFFMALEVGTVLTLIYQAPTDDYELQIDQPDGNLYGKTLLRKGSSLTAFGHSILLAGIYRFRFIPQNDSAVTLQFGFTNNNRSSLHDMDSGNPIAVSLDGWGNEYAKYRLELDAGDLVEISDPADEDVWLYLLNSNSHIVDTGGDEIFTRVSATGAYYLFVVNKDVNNGANYSGTLTITLDPDQQRYPVLDPIPQQFGGVGEFYSLQLSASNAPTKFRATGLPTGLTMNETSGIISGTTMIAGTFPVALTVENEFGNDHKDFLFTVQSVSLPPTITVTPFLTATATVKLLVTPTPSLTVIETPQPRPTPPSGWQKFEDGDVELWLPGSYMELDAEMLEMLGASLENVRGLSADCEQMLQTSDQNLSAISIYAVDFEAAAFGNGLPTSAVVARDQLPPSMTLDTFIDAIQLCDPLQIIEREIVSLGPYQAGRLISEAELLGAKVNGLVYVVADGLSLWIVGYNASADIFQEQMPIFEQSIRTFAIRSED
jgi:hypothetical protein